ncbi:OmpA family protein [uncultured Lutibacter sp.]|uniref:OmpA family protein n=1 Tax=uncultured Lutibacter sp. TaxID=437739 RepID=UPI0026192026|nr:OmpA family protein [uncultured Lutibacter sp.]
MIKFKLAILTVFLVCGLNKVVAQDENNPWAIGIGINAVDFYPTNAAGIITPSGNSAGWYAEFFNVGDHYNVIPAISKLTVSRYITSGFTAELAGSVNKIEKIGDIKADNLLYYAFDAGVKYDLNNLLGETSWFDPYATTGVGFISIDEVGKGSLNGGLGFNLWLNKSLGFNIESKYKHTFASSPHTQHFQHSLGFVVRFGGADIDGDGVFDKDDACPDVFGLEMYNGCPDSDNDGIIDSKDSCPNIAGLSTLNGCPDTDEDGIADNADNCPNIKGTKANGGCPDTDGDNVIDKEDDCPQIAGPKENKGCPWPDADKDGVLDKNDNCINEAGPASNNGCPIITKAEVSKLEDLFKTVYFDTAKDSFKSETISKLDEAVLILKKYPTAKIQISGYTDSKGNDNFNQKLSDKRANSVKSYFVSKGISSTNINAKGYGESMPIASNSTKNGRALNRRVEIKIAQ